MKRLFMLGASLMIGIALLMASGQVRRSLTQTESLPLQRTSLTATRQVVPSASAVPTFVTVNSPTVVTISVQISDPAVITNSVNLVRISPGGATTVVGTLKQVSATQYSIQQLLNETQISDVQLQISAALQGGLRRSALSTVYVTVLPADPGAAGLTTVAGVDSDGDGIRDDVQRAIAQAVPDSESLRLALKDNARATQALLVATNPAQATAAMTKMMSATACLSSLGIDASILNQKLSQLDTVELNTEARFLAWTTSQDLAAGQVYELPTDGKSNCSFDPTKVNN